MAVSPSAVENTRPLETRLARLLDGVYPEPVEGLEVT